MHTHQFLKIQPDEVKELGLKFIKERVKMVKWSFFHAVFVKAKSVYGLQQTFMPSLVHQELRQFLLSVYTYYGKVICT